MTNVFGIYLSTRFKLANRKQFLLLMREKTAKAQLETALTDIKVLQGIIPICAYCKKVRDDQGFWGQVEAYLGKHANAKFSHGICPECTQNEEQKYRQKEVKL